MKLSKYLAALVAALAVTSCGTTQPPKARIVEPDSFGEIIGGIRNVRQVVREGGGLIQDLRRLRQF